jgi:hypothetical protein
MREEVDALLEGNRAMRFHHKLLLARTIGWLTPTQFQELEQPARRASAPKIFCRMSANWH